MFKIENLLPLVRGVPGNCRVKIYPDGTVGEVMACNRDVFTNGLELSKTSPKRGRKPAHEDDAANEPDPANVERARRRAKAKVFDLMWSNPDFVWFVTLTLSKEQIDRYDYKTIVKKMGTWLDNSVRRKGLKYLLVPEQHKDGAYHFHGFFNDVFPVEFSGRYDDGGRPIYNLPAWKFGFSTLIQPTGSKLKTLRYVAKYVTKSDTQIRGRYYLSGGALERPHYMTFAVDYAAFEADRTFTIDGTGLEYKISNDLQHLYVKEEE